MDLKQLKEEKLKAFRRKFTEEIGQIIYFPSGLKAPSVNDVEKFLSQSIDSSFQAGYKKGQKDMTVEYEERNDVCARDIQAFEQGQDDMRKKVLAEIKKRKIAYFRIGLLDKNGMDCVGCGRLVEDCQCDGKNQELIHLEQFLKQ
jgi:hypothetical protein